MKIYRILVFDKSLRKNIWGIYFQWSQSIKRGENVCGYVKFIRKTYICLTLTQSFFAFFSVTQFFRGIGTFLTSITYKIAIAIVWTLAWLLLMSLSIRTLRGFRIFLFLKRWLSFLTIIENDLANFPDRKQDMGWRRAYFKNCLSYPKNTQ